MDMRREAVKRDFISKMLLAYSPPKNVDGSPALHDSLVELIFDAAMTGLPNDWNLDRCTVYAQRLWDKCLLGEKYTAVWPKVDAVRKASVAVVADMVKHDDARQIEHQPVPDNFPDFYAHMSQTMQRPIEDSPYAQQRKADWIRAHGKWPLGDEGEARGE